MRLIIGIICGIVAGLIARHFVAKAEAESMAAAVEQRAKEIVASMPKPEPQQSKPLTVGPPAAEPPRPPNPLYKTETVYVTGYVKRGEMINVCLSDGTTITERVAGEGHAGLELVERNFAKIGGRVFPILAPGARRATVGVAQVNSPPQPIPPSSHEMPQPSQNYTDERAKPPEPTGARGGAPENFSRLGVPQSPTVTEPSQRVAPMSRMSPKPVPRGTNPIRTTTHE